MGRAIAMHHLSTLWSFALVAALYPPCFPLAWVAYKLATHPGAVK